jgi:hypothetical protein
VADDIVARLRDRQRELECWWPDDDPPLTWVGEAADEIERLRAAGDELATRLRWWTDDTDEAYPDHEALRTWEKTRREQ